MVVQVLPRGQQPMDPLFAMKQTCGTLDEQFAKLLAECTRSPDQLDSTHRPDSNLLGHLGSLNNNDV